VQAVPALVSLAVPRGLGEISNLFILIPDLLGIPDLFTLPFY
jgi:hypothetical protein